TFGLTKPIGHWPSRRGLLPKETTPWEQKVTWLKGNCLNPSTYSDLLKDCTSVVHTVGTLLENPDYKKVVQSKSVVEAFGNLRISCKNQNPFKRDANEANNYEKINRDTAIAVANEAARHGSVKSFIYISATDVFPFIDSKYISTKREAEFVLLSKPEFKTVILRPGFIYSDMRMFSLPIAGMLAVSSNISKVIPLPLLPSVPPLHVDTVAEAAIESIVNQEANGIYNVHEITKLADGVV
ncbi:783_t:CDS:2, partial [Paraglomus occultum]